MKKIMFALSAMTLVLIVKLQEITVRLVTINKYYTFNYVWTLAQINHIMKTMSVRIVIQIVKLVGRKINMVALNAISLRFYIIIFVRIFARITILLIVNMYVNSVIPVVNRVLVY